jgi:hypothetical protein
VDIEKNFEGEYWTNRYIVAGATLADASGVAGQIVGIERAVHLTPVLFTRARISDGIPESDVYQIDQVNLFGLSALSGGQLLPLFNVTRVDFSTIGGGRPSRKYLRGCLLAGHLVNGQPAPAYVTQIQTGYANPMLALTAFHDVDGQSFGFSSVYPKVGMRQLRRGSKRKAPTADPA